MSYPEVRPRIGSETPERASASTAQSSCGSTRDEPVTRIFLRLIGSPLPLTYLSMAAGTLFLGAPQIGYVAGNEVISLGLGLVAFCFPLHLLAGTPAFLGRDAVAGLASSILAGVWLVAGVEMLLGGTGDEGSGLGLFYMTAAVLLMVPAAGVALTKVVPAVVIGAISVRFLLTGLFGLTGVEGLERVAGLASPAVALGSLYVGLGLALEDSKRRVVLPLGRRGAGHEAVEGTSVEGIGGAARDAGVRHHL